MSRNVVEYILTLGGNLDTGATSAAQSVSGLAVQAGRTVASVRVLGDTMMSTAKAAYALVDGMAALIDETVTLSANTGLATETIAAMRLAAGATGKQLRDIIPPDLAKRIAETAAGTGEAIRGFRAMGIDGRIMSGELRTADEVLRATIDALQGMSDPTARAAAATQALGKQGEQLLTAFRSSADLDAYIAAVNVYGSDIGPEAVRLTSEWQVATASLSEAMRGLRLTLFEAVGPSLIEAMDSATRGMQAIGRAVDQASVAVDLLSTPFVTLRRGIQATVVAAQELIRQFGGIGRAGGPLAALLDAFAAGSESFSGKLGSLAEELDRVADAVVPVSDAVVQTDDEIAAMAAALGGAEEPAEKLASKMRTVAAETAKARDYMGALRRSLAEAEAARLSGAQNDSRRQSAVFGAAVADPAASGLGDMVAALEAALVPALDRQTDKIATSQQMLGAGAPAGLAAALAPVLGPLALLADIQGTLTKATAIVQGLPDLLASIPDLVIGLVDAIVDLPMALIKRLPEILLGVAKAIFAFMAAPWQILNDLLGGLPEKFAKAIAQVLRRGFDRAREGISRGAQRAAGAVGQAFGIGPAAGDRPNPTAGLPGFDTGAYITRTGLAVVHEGERVLNRSEVMRGGAGGVNIGSINIRSTDPREAAREVARALSPYGGGGRISIGGR